MVPTGSTSSWCSRSLESTCLRWSRRLNTRECRYPSQGRLLGNVWSDWITYTECATSSIQIWNLKMYCLHSDQKSLMKSTEKDVWRIPSTSQNTLSMDQPTSLTLHWAPPSTRSTSKRLQHLSRRWKKKSSLLKNHHNFSTLTSFLATQRWLRTRKRKSGGKSNRSWKRPMRKPCESGKKRRENLKGSKKKPKQTKKRPRHQWRKPSKISLQASWMTISRRKKRRREDPRSMKVWS